MNSSNVVLSILVSILIIMNLIVILGENKAKDPMAQQIKAIGSNGLPGERQTELIKQLIEKSKQ